LFPTTDPMQLTTKSKTKRLRRSRGASQNQTTRSRTALPVSQVRARRGSGIEDQALYSCECGFAWKGEVTASPCCAHCGTPQAW
jgi:hypothetical protein